MDPDVCRSAPATSGASACRRPQPASLDTAKAQLIRPPLRRASREQSIAAADFAFADCSATPFPGKPDPTKLCLKGGFDPRLRL